VARRLVDVLSNFDDNITEKFLAKRRSPPTISVLRCAVPHRRTSRAVLCGSAFKTRASSPCSTRSSIPPVAARHPPTKGLDLKGIEELERPADDNAPFSALAFKIMSTSTWQAHVRRIYSGTIAQGDAILNSTKDRKERIGRIMQMHANHREPRDAAFAGDIIAIVGMKGTTTGDTLCDPPPHRARVPGLPER